MLMICQFNHLVATSFLADILYGHCPGNRSLCIRKIMINGKNVIVSKTWLLHLFSAFCYNLGRYRSTICAYFNSFCFICSEKCTKNDSSRKYIVLFQKCIRKEFHRCHYPQISKSGWCIPTTYNSWRIKYFETV